MSTTTATTTATTTTAPPITSSMSITSTTSTTIIEPTNVTIIWVPIVAVTGTIIIGLLIFFAVRHQRNNLQRSDTETGYEVPYRDDSYAVPYQNSEENAKGNDENAEYEVYEEAYEEYRN